MIYMPYQTTRNADDVRCYKVLSSSCMPLSTSTSFPLPKSMTAMPWKRTLEVTTMYSLSANNEYTATTNDKDSFMLNMSRNYLPYQNKIHEGYSAVSAWLHVVWSLIPIPLIRLRFIARVSHSWRLKTTFPPTTQCRTDALNGKKGKLCISWHIYTYL